VLDGKTARRLHLTKRRKAVTIGTARASFTAQGSRRIGVRLTRRAQRALKNLRSVRTTLRATATDAAGNRRRRSARVRVTR
jgi:hypothetical protein